MSLRDCVNSGDHNRDGDQEGDTNTKCKTKAATSHGVKGERVVTVLIMDHGETKSHLAKGGSPDGKYNCASDGRRASTATTWRRG
jgi:hypothetical protein